jgi:hypothetical protein
MPRKTFTTKQFFVNTSQTHARNIVAALPQAFGRLQLLSENPKLHSFLFFYEQESEQQHSHVTVSLLPLDEQQTQITVHGSYANGKVFYNDPYVTNALANVEAALQAAINGCVATFEPLVARQNLSYRWLRLIGTAAAFLSAVFIWRKFF